MAVQVDSSNQIDEFLRVLKRRAWWIVIPAVLFSTIGIAYAVVVPKKYVAGTRLMVHDTRSEAGVGKDSTAEGRVAEHTIKSRRRVITVLDRLGWEEWLNLGGADQERYLERVNEGVRVGTPPIDRYAGQQLVEISFSHTEPQKAYDFLLLLTDLWKEEVLEKTRNTLKEQLEKNETSRREHEQLATELSDRIAGIRQRYGIRPGQTLGLLNQGPTAPEFEQLADVREQIAETEDELASNSLKVETLLQRYERLDSIRLEEVAEPEKRSDPAIDKLVEKIAEAEGKIRESGWLPDNSRYKSAIREIEAMRRELFSLRETEAPIEFQQVEVQNEEKVRLGEQIAELDILIDTGEKRLELLLAREVELSAKTEELQNAFAQIEQLEERRKEAVALGRQVSTIYAQLKSEVDYLEGPAGNPFTELEAVHASTRPTEPNPVLISAFSIFAGLAVGFGLAVVTEFSKSVFRSVTDVSRAMTVPVLGTVNEITTRAQKRRSMAQRLFMTVATVAFVGVVGYILWAYSYRQDLLSDGMLNGMTNLREALK